MNDPKYTWRFNEKGLKSIKKLDKPVQRRIIQWLNSHIDGYDNPRAWGKALEGEFQTLWRYRVGSYRIIADIHDKTFEVIVVKTSKRGQVYQTKK